MYNRWHGCYPREQNTAQPVFIYSSGRRHRQTRAQIHCSIFSHFFLLIAEVPIITVTTDLNQRNGWPSNRTHRTVKHCRAGLFWGSKGLDSKPQNTCRALHWLLKIALYLFKGYIPCAFNVVFFRIIVLRLTIFEDYYKEWKGKFGE